MRSSGIVPSTTTATGVAASRPPATRAAAIAPAFCTAISSTTVPRSRASAVPLDQRVRVPGRQVAGDDGELVRDAAVGHRDAGHAPAPRSRWSARARPCTGTPASAQAMDLLVAATEDEVSPPLNRTTRLPASARSTMTRLISSWAADRPRGQLGHVDQLDVRRQLVEQLARREPVGDHHVGLAERAPGRDGDQLGVAGAAADQHHAGRRRRRAARAITPVAQRVHDLVADRRGLARLPVAEHRDRDAGVPADGRRPRGRRAGVVGCGRRRSAAASAAAADRAR